MNCHYKNHADANAADIIIARGLEILETAQAEGQPGLCPRKSIQRTAVETPIGKLTSPEVTLMGIPLL